MLDIVIDTIIDLLKIIPFLFVAFLLMEYLEHSISKKRIQTRCRQANRTHHNAKKRMPAERSFHREY